MVRIELWHPCNWNTVRSSSVASEGVVARRMSHRIILVVLVLLVLLVVPVLVVVLLLLLLVLLLLPVLLVLPAWPGEG